jgi:hypothetical protein
VESGAEAEIARVRESWGLDEPPKIAKGKVVERVGREEDRWIELLS